MKFHDKIKKNYQKTSQNIENTIKHTKYIIDENIDKNGQNILNIYSNDKLILTVKYQIMGFYNKEQNLFFWSNINYIKNNNLTSITKKLRSMKKKLEDIIIDGTYEDIQYLESLLYYFDNDIFIIDKNDICNISYAAIYFSNAIGTLSHNIHINDKKHKIYYLVTDILSK